LPVQAQRFPRPGGLRDESACAVESLGFPLHITDFPVQGKCTSPGLAGCTPGVWACRSINSCPSGKSSASRCAARVTSAVLPPPACRPRCGSRPPRPLPRPRERLSELGVAAGEGRHVPRQRPHRHRCRHRASEVVLGTDLGERAGVAGFATHHDLGISRRVLTWCPGRGSCHGRV
jgi:hypothetical protein